MYKNIKITTNINYNILNEMLNKIESYVNHNKKYYINITEIKNVDNYVKVEYSGGNEFLKGLICVYETRLSI